MPNRVNSTRPDRSFPHPLDDLNVESYARTAKSGRDQTKDFFLA